jgi:membrane protease YdiL (CAAX protease family)
VSVSRLSRSRVEPAQNWLIAYGAGFVVAEAVLVVVDVRIGAALHAMLLIALAAHIAFAPMPRDPQIPVLALLPLVRLLALVMPTGTFEPQLWYALIGAPALATTLLTMRALGIQPGQVGLGRPRHLWWQVLIAALGIGFGLFLANSRADLSLRGTPTPLESVVIILVFVAPLEELVFRGLLQYTVAIRSPGMAIGMPSVLYAAMYLGAGTEITLVMIGIGAIFGVAVARTGSLWGVLAAHSLMRLVIEFV